MTDGAFQRARARGKRRLNQLAAGHLSQHAPVSGNGPSLRRRVFVVAAAGVGRREVGQVLAHVLAGLAPLNDELDELGLVDVSVVVAVDLALQRGALRPDHIISVEVLVLELELGRDGAGGRDEGKG